jgi:hypothetical protein
MEPLNYFRQIACTPDLPPAYLPVIALAKTAPKFILPPTGRIFNDELKALPSLMRLPYPVVVIEFAGDEFEEQKKRLHTELERTDPVLLVHDKHVVIAQQEGGGPIVLRHVIYGVADDASMWLFPAMSAELMPSLDHPDHKNGLSLVPRDVEEPQVFEDPDFPTAFQLMMASAGRAVCELIEALSCSNVRHQALPVRKLNKSVKRRGGLPYDEYRILTVDVDKHSVGGDTPSLDAVIEGRSKREHLRRGHIRTYKSGIKIWIQPQVINAGASGKVVKDYLVK